MRIKSFLFCFVIVTLAFSQQDSLRKKLVLLTVQEYQQVPVEKRKFISLKGKSLFTKLNPLTYVAGSLMFVYQRALSEQIQANCNYKLSCSSFTKYSMEEHGMFFGMLIGVDQLLNCFPGVTGDYEKCRVNNEGKIINHPEED